MYTLDGMTPGFKELNMESKRLLSEVVSSIPAKTSSLTIHSNSTLFTGPGENRSLFILREGNIKYEKNDRLIFLYEEGDLVGFEKIYFDSGATIRTEFAVIVDEYHVPDFFEALRRDAKKHEEWNRYLAARMALFDMMFGNFIKAEARYTPSIQSFQPGDVIIEENTEGTEVFTMIDGTADAYVGKTKVGEVLPDEIFGAIAALTGLPRTASVVASSPCTVASAPRDSFKSLLDSRPNTAIKLIEDMARVIVSMNKSVVKLTSDTA